MMPKAICDYHDLRLKKKRYEEPRVTFTNWDIDFIMILCDNINGEIQLNEYYTYDGFKAISQQTYLAKIQTL